MADMLLTGGLSFADAAVRFAAMWLLQSTILLSGGLLIGRLLCPAGAAAQSAVYQATLIAALLCPLAAGLAGATGLGRFALRLPSRPSAGHPPALSELSGAARNAIPESVGAWAEPLPDGNGRSKAPHRPDSAAKSLAPTAAPPDVLIEAPAAEVPTERSGSPSPQLIALLGAAWIAVSLCFVARLLTAVRRTSRLRRSAVPADPVAISLCRELAGRMGVPAPAVLRSPFLCGPCLHGIRRPAVLLPEEDAADPRDVLVHELAHLARRDCLWDLIRRLALATFWFQPLLWVLARRLEATAEEVCDDHVLRHGADRAGYARRLLALAEQALPPLASAGIGLVSLQSMLAGRVTRILDSRRPLSIHAGRPVLAATLLLGSAATAGAGMLGAVPAEQDAPTAAPFAAVEDKAESASGEAGPSVRGRVVGPDGAPLAGAEVSLYPNPERHAAVTAVDGGFRISTGVILDEKPDDMPGLLAVAKKDGFGWAYAYARGQENLTLKLPPLVPIAGRIVDLEGRPVDGAVVRVEQITLPESDLTEWLAAVRRGEPPWTAWRKLGEAPFQQPVDDIEVRTGRDGRFRIDGIGAECRVELSLHGPGIAYARFIAVTRPIEPIRWEYFAHRQQVYGSEFTHAAGPDRPIEGVVRDAATGAPLAGVAFKSHKFATGTYSGENFLSVTTDADGRYRLEGMPKGEGNRLLAVPADRQPYFMREVDVPDPPGFGAIALDVELHRGLLIRGRVTDRETGEPVPGTRLHYFPFLENEHAQAIPEFDERGNTDGDQARYVSDAEGRYKVVVLPGRGLLGAESPRGAYRRGVGFERIDPKVVDQRGYAKTWRNPVWASAKWPNTIVEVAPEEGIEGIVLDLELDPGLSLPVRVLDPEGRPLSEVTGVGRTASPYESATFGPKFELVNLGPDETRTLILRHEGRRFGKVVRVTASEPGPLTVRLEPLAAIEGRLVDADGEPRPGATVRCDLLPHGDFGLDLGTLAADDAGRFRFESVPVGCEYTLFSLAPRDSESLSAVKRYIAVRPGETVEVGDLALSRD
jgi:beta-lactamase regulating signal transducer with metallopeptidase domain